jgi:hypothetical protein
MNFYLSSQLASARQADMLLEAEREPLVRASRQARRSPCSTSPRRPTRRLRLAARLRTRVPA